jgi:hypothetical protein
MDHSRRNFLAAGIAVPAAASTSRSSGQPSQAKSGPASTSPAFRQGLPVAGVVRFPTYAEGYGQRALGRENFLQLPSGQAGVKCGNCPGRTVKCPYGVRVSERLIRAQEIFAC